MVSLLPHAVEVHDVSGATLQPSQHMYFASPISISCSDVRCEDEDGSPVVVVASADTVAILTLIPVAKQVKISHFSYSTVCFVHIVVVFGVVKLY